jgi:hypothetical protein
MKSNKTTISCIAVNVMVVVSLCTPAGQAQQAPASDLAQKAAVPRLVQFSGVVKEAAGRPVVGVTFALYKDQEGGAPIWMETQRCVTGRKRPLLRPARLH